MTSNYCEERDMNSKILEFHEQRMLDMHLPRKLTDLVCPNCLKQYDISSIRNIGLCLNTRNFGDISVEVFCNKCSTLETLYFRENIQTISDFGYVVKANNAITSEPLTEEKMYSSGYNNIVQQMMLAETQKEKKDDIV